MKTKLMVACFGLVVLNFLRFNLFCRYDGFDDQLKRKADMKLKMKMSSIRYIHTQRFQAEILAYMQYFQQLQEVFSYKYKNSLTTLCKR